MYDPLIEEFYQSVHYPERAFDVYLYPKAPDSVLRLEKNAYRVPPAFSKPLIYLLFEIEKKSGYARLHIETEAIKKNQKLRVRWESGNSELGYLNEVEFQALKTLSRDYFHRQISKYGLSL